MHSATARQTDTDTLPVRRFRLVTLGGLTLVDARGDADPTLAKRRRKLAVLAVLALNRRPISRDGLARMFWGHEDESKARHSLADALSNLRRVLGPDSIATRQLDVSLAPTSRLTVDALELVEAAARRDHARVVALYGGAFLQTAEAESAQFELWVERVRVQLRQFWLDACSHECMSLARTRRWSECASLARRWLDADPISADAALYLLNAIKAPGTHAAYQAALAEYHLLEQRLEREYNQSLAREVSWLAASIKEALCELTTSPWSDRAAAGVKHDGRGTGENRRILLSRGRLLSQRAEFLDE